MQRSNKEQVVSSMNQVFAASETLVVAHYAGLTVAEITGLRNKLRKCGASFRVTKNSLTRLSLADTQFEGLSTLFGGPTAVAYSKDPVAAAKGMVEYAKENNKLVILGGAIGSQLIDVAGVESLATLPSIDELRAKIIGLINAPATKIAGVLQAPAAQVARVLSAYASKDNA